MLEIGETLGCGSNGFLLIFLPLPISLLEHTVAYVSELVRAAREKKQVIVCRSCTQYEIPHPQERKRERDAQRMHVPSPHIPTAHM